MGRFSPVAVENSVKRGGGAGDIKGGMLCDYQ